MDELIGQGRTANVYRCGEDKVIKVFHGEFAFLAEEEYSVALNIRNTAAHAPHVYEMIDIDDKKGIVYEYIRGMSMLQIMQKNPLKVWSYARLLADLQTEIHNKAVKIQGLANIKESLSGTILDTQLSQEDKTAILNYLDGLPNDDRLCHYDFHPGNILMFNGKAKVIDWMTAGIGNPCADVCRTSVILNSNILPSDSYALQAVAIRIFRKIFYRAYINQYISTTGKTLKEIEQWLLPVAAARLAENIESEKQYLNEIVQRKLIEHRI